MDEIRVGLDFGTHQTKICVQTIPDEGHGEPMYEFFTFDAPSGEENYFLPSVMQINADNTLSYGYVDNERMMRPCPKPEKDVFNSGFDESVTVDELYDKYATANNTIDDLACLREMLQAREIIMDRKREEFESVAQRIYEDKMAVYDSYLFKYFKQATFAEREWNKEVDCKLLSVWYLSYIIFLLEKKFGKNFSINMGIPADSKTFEAKRMLAVEILSCAYNLVENVYENDMESFLAETVDELMSKTELLSYSDDLKEEYNINIFPEAYAGMLPLTSKGKLSDGMNITVDIGGGTTDISFFTIQKNKPTIYRYWSVPRGLNYIAELSGFDYATGNFEDSANSDVVGKYNRKLLEIVSNLCREMSRDFTSMTTIPLSNLNEALQDRIIVYNGGGSCYQFLTGPISYFTDVKLVDTDLWKEVNMKDQDKVASLSKVLTTAYGLSLGESDDEVKLTPFSELFSSFGQSRKEEKIAIDKDMC